MAHHAFARVQSSAWVGKAEVADTDASGEPGPRLGCLDHSYPDRVSTVGARRLSFEVVVGEDGCITVPADQVAHAGLKPGTRLRLVVEPSAPVHRRSSWGILAGKLPQLSWEDYEDASRVAVADHEARYGAGGRWNGSISQT
jgi:hypothetical protein